MTPERKDVLLGNLKRWLLSVAAVVTLLYYTTNPPWSSVIAGILGTFFVVLAWSLYSTRKPPL
jgi:heme O synthase-like polyprenyltransferase